MRKYEFGAAWFRSRKWFTRKRISQESRVPRQQGKKNKYTLTFLNNIAKNSDEGKFPFFQEAEV